MSRPVKGYEQPLPSLEPDTIDNLAQPTTCSLVVMVRESYQMEVGKWLVCPHQASIDDVQINTSAYDVVRVDMLHENVKNMKVEAPPDDTTLTLCDPITRRIQWRRTSINVDLSAAASASTTASQPHTAPGLIFPETQPDQTQSCLSPIRDQPCLYPPQTRSTPLSTPHQTQPPTCNTLIFIRK
jgi:hypothetical protein